MATLSLVDSEVDHAARVELLRIAESWAPEWRDEDGRYSQADASRVHDRMGELLAALREDLGNPPV